MAKKFTLNTEFFGETEKSVDSKTFKKFIKTRYSDLDLILFASAFAENAGLDLDKFSDDHLSQAMSETYLQLRSEVESGQYEKMFQAEFGDVIDTIAEVNASGTAGS